MDDDEIDDWLDSSDDEAPRVEIGDPTPGTPSFLAETTPVAVMSAPVAYAPESTAQEPAGQTPLVEETYAPPPPPTPPPVSIETQGFVDPESTEMPDEMISLSLSPKTTATLSPSPKTTSPRGSRNADDVVPVVDQSLRSSFVVSGTEQQLAVLVETVVADSERHVDACLETVPLETVPVEIIPVDTTTPVETVPVETIPVDIIPLDTTTPVETVPKETTVPVDATPAAVEIETVSVETVETVPPQTMSVPTMPLETVPIETMSDETRPAENTSPLRASASIEARNDSLGGGDGSDSSWRMRTDAEEVSRTEIFSGFGFDGFTEKFSDVAAAATERIRAAAGSDLGKHAIRSVTDVGKEIGSLAKHVTGEDLAVKGADVDTLGESRNRTDSGTVTQNSSETQTQTSTATQMWSAFGSMAKSSLKAVERAASQVVSDPSIKSFASRSLDAAKNAVTRLEKKANEFQNAVMSANGGTDAATISRIADQAGVALEQGLIERGCAAHLAQLEALADAADAFAETTWGEVGSGGNGGESNSSNGDRFVVFSPRALDAINLILDVERDTSDLDGDADETSSSTNDADVRNAGGLIPGEDASELTSAMRTDGVDALAFALRVARNAFRDELGENDSSDAFESTPETQTMSGNDSHPGNDARDITRSSTSMHATLQNKTTRDAALMAALLHAMEPLLKDAASRVADVTAAIVAHVTDIASSLEADGASTDGWPLPLPSLPDTRDTRDTQTPSDVAFARARLIRGRVRLMVADATTIADAFVETAIGAVSDCETGDGEGFRGFVSERERTETLALATRLATATATRLTEVAVGYAADATRCLRAVVAASAEGNAGVGWE